MPVPVTFAPGVESQLSGFSRGSVLGAVGGLADEFLDISASVVSIDAAHNPPLVVAVLEPSGERLVLRPNNDGWRLAVRAPADGPLPAVHPERSLDIPGTSDVGAVYAVLRDVAARLGFTLPAPPPHPEELTEDLGEGEHRSVSRLTTTVGPVMVTAEVARHEVYDGTTPCWYVVGGSARVLGDGCGIGLSGDDSRLSVLILAPGDLLARLR